MEHVCHKWYQLHIRYTRYNWEAHFFNAAFDGNQTYLKILLLFLEFFTTYKNNYEMEETKYIKNTHGEERLQYILQLLAMKTTLPLNFNNGAFIPYYEMNSFCLYWKK